MAATTENPLKPRKTPVQARSAVTVSAIFEASIQVLLAVGYARLTTTRVAERAGVSVGTLYQYYPNKRALIAAVVEQHLTGIVDAVEATCQRSRGQPLAPMVRAFTDAFIDAKMRRVDVSLALYAPAGEVEGAALVKAAMFRAQCQIADALGHCADMHFADTFMPSLMLMAASVGPVQALLETGPTEAGIENLRQHLYELGMGYLGRIGSPRATS